jgi:transketolase
MLRSSGAGHVGGALSCLDVVAALYFHTLHHDPAQPGLPDRDRFILSAGHKCLAQYAILAEAGYFDVAVLDTYGHLGSHIPGHPDMHKLPGIEANTGALGHGLSIALGMALGLRGTGARVFTILGDGELPEGSNWEAAAAAGHHRADNLTAIVDFNGLQISGRTADVLDMEPMAEKFEAFGWATQTIDGHDMDAIVAALDGLPYEAGRPSAIIARTIKAKGISFAEGKVDYHYWKPSPADLAVAEAEIDAVLATLTKEVTS